MKKPDRFNRIIDKLALESCHVPDPDALVITTVQAKQLLRQQYMEIVELITDYPEIKYLVSDVIGRAGLLAKLKEYEK